MDVDNWMLNAYLKKGLSLTPTREFVDTHKLTPRKFLFKRERHEHDNNKKILPCHQQPQVITLARLEVFFKTSTTVFNLNLKQNCFLFPLQKKKTTKMEIKKR